MVIRRVILRHTLLLLPNPIIRRSGKMPRSELKLLRPKRLELLVIHQKENVSTAMRKAIGNPNVLSFLQ
ncbi:hypothetical protein CsatB_003346 [Cannabis sativa]